MEVWICTQRKVSFEYNIDFDEVPPGTGTGAPVVKLTGSTLMIVVREPNAFSDKINCVSLLPCFSINDLIIAARNCEPTARFFAMPERSMPRRFTQLSIMYFKVSEDILGLCATLITSSLGQNSIIETIVECRRSEPKCDRFSSRIRESIPDFTQRRSWNSETFTVDMSSLCHNDTSCATAFHAEHTSCILKCGRRKIH